MRHILGVAPLVAAVLLMSANGPAEAFKRRPNGCDWIGGDFAEPGEVIFNTGCGAGVRRRAAAPAVPKDEPPKLLDRLDAKAPPNYGASTRKSLGAGIERFQIVKQKVAFGVDPKGNLWRFVIDSKESKLIAPSIDKFYATDAGPLLLLEKDGTLWRADEAGANRVFLDHNVQNFQQVGDLVYVLGVDKRLWRLHADGKTRDLVDETVADFQAVDATLVFVLGADGALWRETGDFKTRSQVGKPITAFAYVADGDVVYATTPNRFLWRKRPTGESEQVDHDVAAFHPVDMNLVYVLATDGRLWQELGERAQAQLVDGDLAVKSGPAAFQYGSEGDAAGQAIYALDRKHGLWAETMPSARGVGQARAP
jgi:hypothetical protein